MNMGLKEAVCGKRPRLLPNLDWLCNSVCFHWSMRVSSTCMHFSAHCRSRARTDKAVEDDG